MSRRYNRRGYARHDRRYDRHHDGYGYGHHRSHHGPSLWTIVIWIIVIVAIGNGAIQITGK